MTAATQHTDSGARAGVIAGLVAYSLWGVFPVYFKWIETVAPLEVLAHRVVWAVPFGLLIILWRRQLAEVRRALTHRNMLLWLGLAAVCIGANWLIYIWAVQNDRIFEASLGYYINPLMYVLAGVILFGERLRRLQKVAVGLAAVGVGYLAFRSGSVPWAALGLATLFTAYGAIRKRVVIGAMPGLFVETLLLFPLAAAWMVWLLASGAATFGNAGVGMSALLMFGGPVTVVPLLLFAIAARSLPLTTIGFMQFLAPTLQFGTGLYYGETLTPAHVLCFICIWAAVICFSFDALRAGKKRPLKAKLPGA